MSVLSAQLQGQVAETRARIEELNRERKLQQTAAGRELGALERELMSILVKNSELEAACRELEAQVVRE